MPALAILIGTALLLVGIGGYGYAAGNGHASPTALIPAIFGVLILLCGVIAILKENLRKHLMHGALVVALLGILGTASGFIKAFTLISGGTVERPAAVIAQTITAMLCLIFVIFGIKSFISARKKRIA